MLSMRHGLKAGHREHPSSQYYSDVGRLNRACDGRSANHWLLRLRIRLAHTIAITTTIARPRGGNLLFCSRRATRAASRGTSVKSGTSISKHCLIFVCFLLAIGSDDAHTTHPHTRPVLLFAHYYHSRMYGLALPYTLTTRTNPSRRPDFIITQPGASASWANGSPYPVTWVKGREDGIDAFDIELMRLHTDGLYLVAKNGTHAHHRIALSSLPV